MQTTTIRQLIREPRAVIAVDVDVTALDAARKMAETHKGCVLVVGQGRLHGIFTERDLLMRVVAEGRDPARTPLREVMTTRIVVVTLDETWFQALRKMSALHCRHLPVVDEADRIVAVISRRDLMPVQADPSEEDEFIAPAPATLTV